MKRIVLAFCVTLIVLIAVSFTKPGNKHKITNRAIRENTGSNSTTTLNGIPHDIADSMVKNFANNRGSYDTTARTSIWFSRSTFHGMDSVLIAQKLDGLRIYFAKDSKGKNTIVVVSTIYAGTSSSSVYTIVHKDYFQTIGDELYSNNTDVNGVVSYDSIGGNALLYTKNPGCPAIGKDGCDPNKPHYITCQRAYDMVNKFGSDPINVTSEWYDAGIIKDLDSCLNAQSGDGIRIYFARHLDPDMFEASDTVHRHGFVLITTLANGSNHKDYFNCFVTHPLYAKATALLTNKLIKGIPVMIEGGSDNGELCPDNCDGATLP